MMDEFKVSCFLPCRKGSERIRNKNTRRFSGFSSGLIEIKLSQLIAADSVATIVLSTDDENILDFADSLNSSKLRLHKRDESLASSQTSTDELVAHALELIPVGHIMWTHVTSPFCNADLYERIIQRYFEGLRQGYDSLMTTTQLHGFFWGKDGPLNYDRTVERWPRTQTLDAVNEVNSAAFIASADVYKKHNDRIGTNPLLFSLGKLEGFDIDWPEDFVIAECLLEKGLVSV